jgi:hypothetical protein
MEIFEPRQQQQLDRAKCQMEFYLFPLAIFTSPCEYRAILMCINVKNYFRHLSRLDEERKRTSRRKDNARRMNEPLGLSRMWKKSLGE